ncbi:hypothetical protein DRH14_03925, partial [Candidatus Shapirobacteria bacterium]
IGKTNIEIARELAVTSPEVQQVVDKFEIAETKFQEAEKVFEDVQKGVVEGTPVLRRQRIRRDAAKPTVAPKTIIKRTIEKPSKKITIEESKALKVKLRAEARGAREAAKEAATETRTKIREETKKIKSKKELVARLNRELKTTKVKKVSGKPVGKFTPRIQKILDEMVRASKLTAEEGQLEIEANLENLHGALPSEEIRIQNEILGRFSGIKDKTVAELQNSLDILMSTKETGNIANALEKFNRDEEVDRWRNKAIEQIRGGKGVDVTLKTTGANKARFRDRMKAIGSSQVGFTDIMDILSFNDKATKKGEGFLNEFGETLDAENAEAAGNQNATADLRKMFFDSFQITKDSQMNDQMHKDSDTQSLGVFKNAEGNDVEIQMSKSEARKRWMELQDPTLDQTFRTGMAYTQEIIDGIDSFLSQQDKVFAKAQLEYYKKYYEGVNKTYRELYGVDLPKNPFYSPIMREDIAKDMSSGFGEFGQEISSRRSITTGSMKTRVANIKPITKQSDVQVLQSHVSEMEHFKAWAQKVKDLSSVFTDPTVRSSIKQEFGGDIIGVIDGFLKDFTSRGAYNSNNIRWFDRMRVRFVRSVLAAKPSIAVKQLVSTIAYADDIPIGQFAKGEIDFWKSPLEHYRFLKKNSQLFAARGENMERDIKNATQSDQYKAFRKGQRWLDSLMLNIKLGDQAAIAIGGWAVYKHHHDLAIKNGKTELEAKDIGIRQFERTTKRAQQSAALSDLSKLQRGGGFAKVFTMFLSSPNLYMRKELGAIRNLAAGRVSAKQAIKTISIYHILLPMLFQFVSDFGKWDWEEQKRAMIFGSLNGIFIVGDGLDYILRKALGQRAFEMDIAPLQVFEDLGKFASEVKSGDVWGAARELFEVTGLATGLPAKYVADFSTGVGDVLGGNYTRGVGQVAGWSPWAIDKAIEDDGRSRKSRTRNKRTRRTRTQRTR